MSAIALPRRATGSRHWASYDRIVLFGTLAMAFGLPQILSLRQAPFADPVAQSGDASPANVVLWLGLLLAAVPVAIRQRDRLQRLVAAAWPIVPLLAWSWLSIGWSIAPDIALRRVGLETIVIAIVLTLAAQQSGPDEFVRSLALFAALLLPIELLATVATPDAAISADGWQGIHGNKNTAGSACMLALIAASFGALSTATVPRRLALIAAILGWCILLVLSRSKTSAGVLVVAIAAGLFLSFGMRRGPRAFAAAFALLVLALALVSVPFGLASAGRIFSAVFHDSTFTGRTFVWGFLARWIARSPWTGVGFGSFWQIGTTGPADTGGLWFVAVAGEGHNGYLDLAATIGYVGLALFLLLPILCAARLFQLSARPNSATRRIALGGLLALLVAALCHNAMESSFLRGGFPVWVLSLFAMAHVFLLPTSADVR